MNELAYILDQPLDVSQDFDFLKEEGLSFIQKYSKGEWTNFNPSDPGITILDQVCYALTELGYCTDFPIADILTKADGQLAIEDQFYLPERILTTSPLTLTDYRKYIIDQVEDILNVLVKPIKNRHALINEVYSIRLKINLPDTELKEQDVSLFHSNTCSAVFNALMGGRNLGDIFDMPEVLIKKEYLLSGEIVIDNIDDLAYIIGEMQTRADNFVFPKVNQVGYNKHVADDLQINEILNGPILKNGWIKTSSLGEKRDKVNANQLSNIFHEIPGIYSIPNLTFKRKKRPRPEANSGYSKIIFFNIIDSLKNEELSIICNGKNVRLTEGEKFDLILEQLDLSQDQGDPVSTVLLVPELPKGKFRDINSYYSIQNTFPESYAVGSDSTPANATNYQIAQSRQLKGYLTLFDQVIANQFSQLANISNLFSFKNVLIGDPSDEAEFYETKDQYEKIHLQYPVPYLVFSPTYFYQSLYQVPYIKPLLKNNDIFDFGYARNSIAENNKISWDRYKDDPYNSYIKGLMDYMEDDAGSLERRDRILNYLLAQYGYSPYLLNQILDGSKYTGNKLNDKVIYKSLLLQNLGLLSYYRQKAYNYKAAEQISIIPEDVLQEDLLAYIKGYNLDFIFNAPLVNKLEKLTETDFVNYSAIELYMNLVLGLRIQYEDYIVANTDISWVEIEKPKSKKKKKKKKRVPGSLAVRESYWMIKNRRGTIAIETNLLLSSLKFRFLIKSVEESSSSFYHIEEKLSYSELNSIKAWVNKQEDKLLGFIKKEKYVKIDGKKYHFAKVKNPKLANNHFAKTKHELILTSSMISNGTDSQAIPDDWLTSNNVIFIFPDFIEQFKSASFERRFDILMESALPVHVGYCFKLVDELILEDLIVVFSLWHNLLKFKANEPPLEGIVRELELAGSAFVLVELLKLLNLKSCA